MTGIMAEGVPIPSSIPSLPIQSSLLDFSASLDKMEEKDEKKEQADPNLEEEKPKKKSERKKVPKNTSDSKSEMGAPEVAMNGKEKPLDLVSEMGLDRAGILEKTKGKGKERGEKKKKRSLGVAKSEAGDF